MKSWFDIGFMTHGVLNLTPKESLSLCESGAAIVDVK